MRSSCVCTAHAWSWGTVYSATRFDQFSAVKIITEIEYTWNMILFHYTTIFNASIASEWYTTYIHS